MTVLEKIQLSKVQIQKQVQAANSRQINPSLQNTFGDNVEEDDLEAARRKKLGLPPLSQEVQGSENGAAQPQ